VRKEERPRGAVMAGVLSAQVLPCGNVRQPSLVDPTTLSGPNPSLHIPDVLMFSLFLNPK